MKKLVFASIVSFVLVGCNGAGAPKPPAPKPYAHCVATQVEGGYSVSLVEALNNDMVKIDDEFCEINLTSDIKSVSYFEQSDELVRGQKLYSFDDRAFRVEQVVSRIDFTDGQFRNYGTPLFVVEMPSEKLGRSIRTTYSNFKDGSPVEVLAVTDYNGYDSVVETKYYDEEHFERSFGSRFDDQLHIINNLDYLKSFF